MFQVRFHGRGGQGTVTAAELLSVAAFHARKYAQAFPSFGPERTGAPVAAYCRIDTRPIRTHEPIVRPDAIVVADARLLHLPEVTAGLAPGGVVILNAPDALPANEIAERTLGQRLPYPALLGALAARTGIVTFDALAAAISARFSGTAREGNLAASRAGWEARC